MMNHVNGEVKFGDPDVHERIRCVEKSLSKRSQDVLRKRFNENESSNREAIQAVKTMLQEKDLTLEEDDEFVLKILRYRKYNLKNSAKTIEQYMEQATTFEENIGVPDPEVVRKVLRHGILGLLPYKNQDEMIVVTSGNGQLIFDSLSTNEILQAIAVAMFYSLQDPSMQVNGVIYIVDVAGAKFYKMTAYINFFRHLFSFTIGKPFLRKRVHIVNCQRWIVPIWKIVRSLMPHKLIERLIFHDNKEELLQYFHPSILPRHLNGDLEDECTFNHWDDQIEPTCQLLKEYVRKYSRSKKYQTD